jgi:hypothetical protein
MQMATRKKAAKPAARRRAGEASRKVARKRTVGTAPARRGAGRSREPVHLDSATAVAAEALRTGIVPHATSRLRDDDSIPGEAERIRVGDPDDDALSNEYVGDDTPGGSTPTPDQGNVDDIGRAYGLQDEDSGELRTSTELMETRDRRRRGLALKRRRS